MRQEAAYYDLPFKVVNSNTFALLDWRAERKKLPAGSTPLALGTEIIGGEWFSEGEVREFHAQITGAISTCRELGLYDEE
jgi:hypothetical protein